MNESVDQPLTPTELEIKNRHMHKNSTGMARQPSASRLNDQSFENNFRSQLNQSHIQDGYQLRSPVRQIVDDFSNNTLTGLLNSEYQTTQSALGRDNRHLLKKQSYVLTSENLKKEEQAAKAQADMLHLVEQMNDRISSLQSENQELREQFAGLE